MDLKSNNITWTVSPVTRENRSELLRHGGSVIWLTGLSGSGKSTLATRLQYRLHLRGMSAFILDGDNIRHGLCSNLAFSPEDRSENIRRAGEAAKLMAEAGIIVICSLISPFRSDRNRVREICGLAAIPFAEVFLNTPLEVCESRDVKGLYKRARAGEIKDFTGINSPYEAPEEPELEIRSGEFSLESSVDALLVLATSVSKKPPSAADSSNGSGI
ncbi:MAG: adenylyl-sulfate kinase [Terrimicrobiaceae bacterium]